MAFTGRSEDLYGGITAMNVYYNAVTHAINIDKGSQITEIKMPANVTPTQVIQLITSEAFAPTIDGIISK